jgi:hypothetical protein
MFDDLAVTDYYSKWNDDLLASTAGGFGSFTGLESSPNWDSIASSAVFGTLSANSQSVPTPVDAETSWTGLAKSLPQYVQTAVDVAKTGFGLSLAKDQLSTSRDLNKLQLATQLAQGQSAASIAASQARTAANNAALQAAYPLGIPFGKTRNDQMLILFAVAAGALLLMNRKGAL